MPHEFKKQLQKIDRREELVCSNIRLGTLGHISAVHFQGIIYRTYFILAYRTNSGRMISRNLLDLHLLPHHLRNHYTRFVWGETIFRKAFICIKSKHSRGVNLAILEFWNGRAVWCSSDRGQSRELSVTELWGCQPHRV